MRIFKQALIALSLALAAGASPAISAAEKRIVLVAGSRSHGAGEHEFRAGCLLLKSCLDNVSGITSVVYSNGWPANPNAFDGASAVVIYADGGQHVAGPVLNPARFAG